VERVRRSHRCPQTEEVSMSRVIRVAAAQLGPVARPESRTAVIARLITLMRRAESFGAKLVVYPEMALTTFFPRWVFDDPDEADAFCESEMPNAEVQPLFEEAVKLGIGFYLGYAELAWEGGHKRRFNSAVLVDGAGNIVGKYRKVHIPGMAQADPNGCAANFEKRYFENGDLGFPVFRTFGGIMGMCLCNDRRWPETYRVMSLQGAEMILVGYNTGATRRVMVGNQRLQEPAHLASFHNHLVMQAGAYQNCCWVIGVAKAGPEEGSDFVVGDEVVVADCDLDLAEYSRKTLFNFEANRQIQHYGIIAAQRGVVMPAE
jgi:predicted amidohydrolase